jgi:hypothetical protein
MTVNLHEYGLSGKRESMDKAAIVVPEPMGDMCPMCHQALPQPEAPEEESKNIKIEIEVEVPVGQSDGSIS